ncbi:MAG: hypothetical protein AAGF11_00920 [Myxococcota bacterium]
MTTFDVPLDTAMFSPQQLHPWTLAGFGMRGWAHWLREHLVSFPALVRDHGTGVVIVGIELEYLGPLTFFDADALQVAYTVRVREAGDLLRLCAEVDARGRAVACVRLVGRIVRIPEGGTLAARPGVLPGSLLDRFDPDERFDGSVPRVLGSNIRDVSWSPAASSALRVHRGHCEAADQWLFAELPRIVADARETWGLTAGDDPRARVALGTPLRRFVAELTRPMFIFDTATLSTQTDHTGCRYLHQIRGATHTHATAYEELGEPSGAP